MDTLLMEMVEGTLRMVRLAAGLGRFVQAEPGAPSGHVPQSPNFWMPNAASTVASSVDGLFDSLVWISVVSTIGVVGAMVYFCIRYRAKNRAANERALSQNDHSNTLEVTWSVIPLVVVVGLFVAGFKQYADMRSAPRAAYEVHATGQKWKWNFEYPGGLSHPELHVPVNRNVRVLIQSVDVLHSLSIPEFRVKMDAVPGRYTELWFNATQTGDFPVYCTEYCGTSHSDMLSRAIVHSESEFEAWVKGEIDKIERMPPVELGQLTFNQSGCSTCHSIDGTRKIGPSLKGLFERSENIIGGTVQVDENYLRESILDPQAKIVQGFPPSMPTFKGQLSDRRVNGLIEYIKSLK